MTLQKVPGSSPLSDTLKTMPGPGFGSSAYGPSPAVDYRPDNQSYFIAWTGPGGSLHGQTL